MSEKTAELPIREKADYYVSDVNELIGKLTQRPPEDFLNMQANTGLLNRYKSWKEKLFNLKEPRNPDGKYLNANERRVIEVAYNELRKLVDEDREGAALSDEIAHATNVPADWWLTKQELVETGRNHPIDAPYLRRAAESGYPPPPYHKGGKRKTRRRRKLKKRKTMKKKRLRRKKTMKKRKSRKRRKTKKRRSKRR